LQEKKENTFPSKLELQEEIEMKEISGENEKEYSLKEVWEERH
jgi:hypothetical protein